MSLLARDSERGAVLIQVAILMLALTGFLMFVVDYGILWVSRSQAQNAADAGALAAAAALAFDPSEPNDSGSYGRARSFADGLARANPVFGDPVTPEVQFNLHPAVNDPCAGFSFPAACEDEGANCTLVCIYRTVPMWIGPLVSAALIGQSVAASAVAWARPANASRCLRPWAIVDRNSTGTSLTRNSIGDTLVLQLLPPGPPGGPIPPGPGWLMPLDLAEDIGAYEGSIEHCTDALLRLGDALPSFDVDELGPDPAGITADAARLIEGDIVIPVFEANNPGTVVNFVGLHLEVDASDNILARITTGSGLWDPEHGVNVAPELAFVKAIQLVR